MSNYAVTLIISGITLVISLWSAIVYSHVPSAGLALITILFIKAVLRAKEE